MNKSIKKVLQIASVYIGTVIGAGFASGQEMIQFFTSYGKKGIMGLIMAGVLYAIMGSIILEIIYEKKYSSYSVLIKEIMGNSLGKIIEIIVNLFMFVCFSTMLAGAGAIMQQEFNLSPHVGALIMLGLCIITFISGTKGFVKMNSILVPILCIGGVILGGYIIIFRETEVFSMVIPKLQRNWILSAILYVCYNTITVIVVLCTLHNQLEKRKIARWGGILGGTGLGILGLSIGLTTLIYYNKINTLEIPMLGILMNYPHLLKKVYMIVLLAAMYTTAIANGYGVVENLAESYRIKKRTIIIGVSILGFLGAQMGFSNIVSKVFPIFGYIGLFEILLIMVYYGCMRIEHRRKGIEHR
ncbi:MAG: YkvI family membrane protein [Peptostreptococcaceae bacterium]